MTKSEMRQQARDMRQSGMSVREIAAALGVSKGSVSMWVRDIVLTDEQIHILKARQSRYGGQYSGAQTNRDNARRMRESFQEQGRIKARERRPLHMAGCMLYWAEGAKHRNKLYFVNSDPNMLRFYVRFLREELGVIDEQMSVHIHCHSDRPDEIQRIERYWPELLHLPASCLKKTFVKKGSDVRKNTLRNGICGIAVHRTELTQHIYGAIQEYAGFDNPDWLY